MSAEYGSSPQGAPTVLTPESAPPPIVAKPFPIPVRPPVLQVVGDMPTPNMVAMQPIQGSTVLGATQTTSLTLNEQVGEVVYSRVQTSVVNCTATHVDDYRRQQATLRGPHPPPPPPTSRSSLAQAPPSPPPLPNNNNRQHGGSSPPPLSSNWQHGGSTPAVPYQARQQSGWHEEPPPLPSNSSHHHSRVPVTPPTRWESSNSWQGWNSSSYGHYYDQTPDDVQEVYSSDEEAAGAQDTYGGANPWENYRPTNGWVYSSYDDYHYDNDGGEYAA